MREISDKALAELRAGFAPGTRVRLVCMDDPYTTLRPGDMGTVIDVDCIGTIHVEWDNGSTLGVAYGADRCEKITTGDP